MQALQGVAEKARTSTPWLNSNPTLREMLDRQLAEGNPSTPRSPFDNGAGPNIASVSHSISNGHLYISLVYMQHREALGSLHVGLRNVLTVWAHTMYGKLCGAWLSG